MANERKKSTRRFPAIYEKIIPIALGFVILGSVILLGIIVAVLAGVLPGLK